jgi:hypothetical protein
MKKLELRSWDKNPVCECVFFLSYFNLVFEDIKKLRALFKRLNIRLTLIGPSFLKSKKNKYQDFVFGKCIMGVSTDTLSAHLEKLRIVEKELEGSLKNVYLYGLFIDDVFYTRTNIQLLYHRLNAESYLYLYKNFFSGNIGFLMSYLKSLSLYYFYRFQSIGNTLRSSGLKQVINKII